MDSNAVLIVEDEQHLADGLRFNLEAEGYTVNTVGDGEAALALLVDDQEHYDALVLDVMLPGKDGFAVAAELRAAGHYVPVLMLTARGRPEDVLRGFESGADDYLPKPFELSVLLARLNALLRRRQWFQQDQTLNRSSPSGEDTKPQTVDAEPEEFRFAGRIIDFGKLELRTAQQTIRLTLMEAELLRYLIKQAGNVVSRKAILEDVWGLKEDTDTRAIDNFVVRLRKYLEDDPAKPRHLLTVRGVGYRFVPQGE
ncbi:MAG: two-component system, OmpR family, alkaline phosphatase synthesis response regulator PhoP [Blastocatellia bacterium]|jgi:DNA-binding response OmpR family regulator|nr:two-component system, OmpR family, alkaline phosphatase synthesis response regulator PhoP [Blastocatellia bacterium]